MDLVENNFSIILMDEYIFDIHNLLLRITLIIKLLKSILHPLYEMTNR